MTIRLSVMLWAQEGREAELTDYEDQVLQLLPDHGARVVVRARTDGEQPDMPLEIHIIEFPSEEALQSFMEDERRQALAPLRDRAVARTEVARVELIQA